MSILQPSSWPSRVRWGLVIAMFLGYFVVVQYRQAQRVCKQVNVEVADDSTLRFVNANELGEYMRERVSTHNETSDRGVILQHVSNLKAVEHDLLNSPYLKRVMVSRSLSGDVTAYVEQVKPLARWTTGGANDVYIGEDGRLMPLSPNFSARVLTLQGQGIAPTDWQPKAEPLHASLLSWLNRVNSSPFWQQLFAAITINSDMEVTILPQIGQQTIFFGTPTDTEHKLAKLMAFYHQVVPKRGWSAYRSVNLAYKYQLICE